jgi:nucleoside-diphosphate-sugar epimerase
MLQSAFRFRDLRDIFLSLNDDSGEFFILEPGDHLFNEQRLLILNRSGEIMKYVVTGGAGFIGSHIAESLASEHEVVIIDDFSKGKIGNISDFSDDVHVVTGTITDLSLLNQVFKETDGIFHHAAIASVAKSVEDPLSTHEVNITGTLNVLLAARDCGVKKVVFASTSAVYGDEPTLPKREDMPPVPLSPYAISKLTCEYYCTIFSELYGVNTASLRYFNVYGPRQDPSSDYAAVIPKFIDRLLIKERPVIFGDGKQTRDFVYVQDVVQANILAMESPATGIYNIGSGQRTDLNSLARTLSESLNVDSSPVYEQARPGDIRDSVSDTTAAKNALGYEARYSLKDGLAETIRGFSS